MAGRWLKHMALSALVPAAILLAWEFTARSGTVSGYLLPAFSRIMIRIADDIQSGIMTKAVADTVVRLAIAYAAASVLGVSIGLAMARSAGMRWLFDPIVSIAYPAPKIAFLPIFVLWFGVFDATKILIGIASCIFPVIAGTYAATTGVDKYLLWSARNLGTPPRAMTWEIVLPAALPQIFTALQVALPLAFISVIVAEMLTGGSGLGGSMMRGARLADPTRVFANLIVIGLVGMLAMGLLSIVRRRLLAWHEEVQRAGQML